jgi:hypothetical protein
MPDIVNNIVSRYRADTSQAEAAVKRLRGVERERAKTQLDALNTENDKLERHIKTWTKVAVGVGVAVGAYKALQAASKAYLEDIRLEAAATGANIDKLKEAVHGLVEEDDLLAFAGKALHGTWKLNQEQMGLVLQGSLALRKQFGGELLPIVNDVSEAFAKGATKSLRQYGITAKDATGVMKQFDEMLKGVGGSTELTGDSALRAGVKWRDAIDNLVGSLGRVAIALSPIVEALASIAEKISSVVSSVLSRDATNAFWDRQMTPSQQQIADAFAARGMTLTAGAGPAGAPAQAGRPQLPANFFSVEHMQANRSIEDEIRNVWHQGTGLLQLGFQKLADNLKKKRPEEIFKGDVGDPIAAIRGVGSSLEAGLRGVFEGSINVARENRTYFAPSSGMPSGVLEAQKVAAEAKKIADVNARILEQNRGRNMLEAIFGSPGDIDLTTTALGQLGKGFNVVAQAGASAMDAWITGQQSLGQAIRGAVAEGLRGVAVQSTVEALKEVAFGVANLAMFNYGGAALHFKAAALFGGVAVAAGFGARAMGAGHTSTSAGSPASSSGPSSGGGAATPAAPQQRQVVIMLGRDFLGLTDLEQRQLIYQATKQATSGQITTTNIRRA